MARMPGALWKPLPNPSKSFIARYDLYVVHTMVGSLAGTDAYFRGLTNGVNSHFGIGGYGENWQWVDTAFRSGANGGGNHRAITAENADMGPGFKPWNTRDGSAVPPLTPQQIETNAQNLAWAHHVHGVPLQLAPNSLPGSRGLAYHRQGIDPWRVAGGEVWSASRGKVCPADRRVAQIPQILARAIEIVNGDDMQIDELYDARDAEGRNWLDFQNFMTDTMAEFARRDAAMTGQVAGLSAAVTALAQGVDDVDADDLKAHISAEVDRAMAEFRARVAEGYDVRLEPKGDA